MREKHPYPTLMGEGRTHSPLRTLSLYSSLCQCPYPPLFMWFRDPRVMINLEKFVLLSLTFLWNRVCVIFMLRVKLAF